MFSYALREQEASHSLGRARAQSYNLSHNGYDAFEHFFVPGAVAGMAAMFDNIAAKVVAIGGVGYAAVRGGRPAAKLAYGAVVGSRRRVERLKAEVDGIKDDVNEDVQELTLERLVDIAESVAKATGKMRSADELERMKEWAPFEAVAMGMATWNEQMMSHGAIHRQAADYATSVMNGALRMTEALRLCGPLARKIRVDMELDGHLVDSNNALHAFLAEHTVNDEGVSRFDAKWTLSLRDLRNLQDWTNDALKAANRWFHDPSAERFNPGHEIDARQYETGLLF